MGFWSGLKKALKITGKSVVVAVDAADKVLESQYGQHIPIPPVAKAGIDLADKILDKKEDNDRS